MKNETKNPTATRPVLNVNENASHEEQIAQRAYELWQKRGGGHGDDRADWLQAEQEIVAWHLAAWR